MVVSKFRKLSFCLSFSWLCYGGLAMASSDSSGSSREIDQTPTWAVAGICTVFILISITFEKSLHKVGTWLGERHKRALLEALEKVKAELMILGFISLVLTFGQSYIVGICIPIKTVDKLLPCPYTSNKILSTEEDHHTKLVSYGRRYLSADTAASKCKEGHEPLLSVNALHQLHILIFFLAVLHVLYSALTMLLGRLQIRGCKAWEAETSSHGYEFANDPSRFRLCCCCILQDSGLLTKLHLAASSDSFIGLWVRLTTWLCAMCLSLSTCLLEVNLTSKSISKDPWRMTSR